MKSLASEASHTRYVAQIGKRRNHSLFVASLGGSSCQYATQKLEASLFRLSRTSLENRFMEKSFDRSSNSTDAAASSHSCGQGMLPAAPPVLQHLDFQPYVRVVQGQGFHTSPAEENELVPFQATVAELRCLAQHHLERVLLQSLLPSDRRHRHARDLRTVLQLRSLRPDPCIAAPGGPSPTDRD